MYHLFYNAFGITKNEQFYRIKIMAFPAGRAFATRFFFDSIIAFYTPIKSKKRAQTMAHP